jgi:hypothetical protein
MSPSPATQLEEERSLIFWVLATYVKKSDRCGEIQTDAPVSMMTFDLMIELERHNGVSIVEIIAPCIRNCDGTVVSGLNGYCES